MHQFFHVKKSLIIEIVIRWSISAYVQLISNLDFVSKLRLTRSNHIYIAVAGVHSMLGNLWAILDSASFDIRSELVKISSIPVLQFGWVIVANCDS